MKKWMMDIRVQKAFLPLAIAFVAMVWAVEYLGTRGWWSYVLLAVGVFFLILDRFFKPREREQMEKEGKKITRD